MAVEVSFTNHIHSFDQKCYPSSFDQFWSTPIHRYTENRRLQV